MRIFILIMLWANRIRIARFLGRTLGIVGEFFRRVSEEREAERAEAQNFAGPHGGFDTNERRRY